MVLTKETMLEEQNIIKLHQVNKSEIARIISRPWPTSIFYHQML